MQGPGLKGRHWGIWGGGTQRKCILKKCELLWKIQPRCFLKVNRSLWVSHLLTLSPFHIPSSTLHLPPREKIIVLFPGVVLLQGDSLGTRIRRLGYIWNPTPPEVPVFHICLGHRTALWGAAHWGGGCGRNSNGRKVWCSHCALGQTIANGFRCLLVAQCARELSSLSLRTHQAMSRRDDFVTPLCFLLLKFSARLRV